MKHQQKRRKTDYTHPKIPIPILPWSKLIQGAISRLGLVESWKMPTFLCFPVASQVIKSYWKRVFFMNPSGPDPWKCGLAMPCQLFFWFRVRESNQAVCVCASLSEESVKWPRLHSVCALTIQARDHSDIPWHFFLGKVLGCCTQKIVISHCFPTQVAWVKDFLKESSTTSKSLQFT